MMENEIDEDELAAMLAEDDQQEDVEEKNESSRRESSFVQQAEMMTSQELVQLTCSLVDEPTPVKKTSTYKLSDADMGELFGSTTSK